MTFNQRLKRLRENVNLTPEQLAEEIKFTKTIIWSYENGKKDPSLAHLIIIAEYFNVSIDYLLRGNNVSVDLEQLVNNDFQAYSVLIDNQSLSKTELEEAVTYIKIKRIIAIKNQEEI